MELNMAYTKSKAKRKNIINIIYYNYKEKGYIVNKYSKKGINPRPSQDKKVK